MDQEAADLELRVQELHVQEQREAAAAEPAGSVGVQRWHHVAGGETHHRGSDSPQFFRDLFAARRGDWGAAERLAANQREAEVEPRALGNSGGAGGSGGEFAPPLWLIQDFVTLARPGRTTADRCTKDVLPEGHASVNIPRVSGGTTTAVQSTQNTALSQTDVTTNSLSSGITTIGGKQVVSLQLIEQSGVPFDRVILGDLVADHTKQLGLQVLSGSGASGQLKGILTAAGTNQVTYTSASRAVASNTHADSFLSQVLNATEQVLVGIFQAPTAIVMHPRRWNWILDALDTTGRPLVVPQGQQFNGPAVSTNVVAEGSCGLFAGLPVYVDPNIPTNLGAGTNQDPVIVAKFDECYLWESPLEATSFDAPYADSLAILFRVHNYSAFIPDRRPTAISVINGTGLVAPSL